MKIGRFWAKAWPSALFCATICSTVIALTRFSTSHVVLRWLCAVAGIIAFASLVLCLDLRHRRAARRSPPEQSGGAEGGLDLPGLLHRQRAAVRNENLAAIPHLVRMITQPTDYRTRTSESVSLQGLVIEQQVSIEFAFSPETVTVGAPPAQPETATPQGLDELYVPVLLPRKNESTDNLVIRDSQDQAISTLCYEETVNLISLALRFLILSCTGRPGGTRRTRPNADQIEKRTQAELLLLNLIYSVATRSPAELEPQIQKAFGLLEINESALDDAQLSRVSSLREFVVALSNAYPIIAVIPYDHSTRRLSISYRRTMIPALPRKDRRTQLRLALGLRPFKVKVNTALAQVSKSYHLHILGPGSQYLMEQTLRCAICGRALTRAGVTPPRNEPDHVHHNYSLIDERPYYEIRGKRGQSYAHLYMRGFDQARGESLVLSASFGETPPGTLASAAITGAMSCLLIGAVGHAQMSGIDDGSDIPPLLLAMPTVAASWFGFASDTEAVLRSSLVGRCSLLLGGITSLLAAALFLVTGRPQDGPQPATTPSLLGMHIPSWWLALFLVAAVNMLYALTQLMIRTSSYRRLLLRREPDGTHTEPRTLE
jgi:hypothetical protein